MTFIIQLFFFVLMIVGASLLIYTKNIVHAVYALALVLLSLAGIYVFLQAELLAVVQVLLYAGGVVVLLLFGLMMTNRPRGGKVLSESKNIVLAAIVSTGLFFGFAYLFATVEPPSVNEVEGDPIKTIGESFLTEHLVAFELIAFVLLVALVGAAYLAKTSADG